MLPADRRRQERVAAMSDDELERYIGECSERERVVKFNKARRSWRAGREAAEAELDRRRGV
jgi:hypothetical protein